MESLTRKSVNFSGFAAPTSNTTFIPNQFVDVCLPYYSRAVIRLVGYMLRQALGWCDADGNPRTERISISDRELSAKAGISRSQIRKVIDEAIAGHFIECVREGKAATASSPAITAIYRLRWVETNTRKYHCRKCKTKIAITDVEEIFLAHLREYFTDAERIAGYLREARDKVKDHETLFPVTKLRSTS